MSLDGLAQWWADKSTAELVWLGIGLAAQLMFSMRFLIQWIATERARASIVPETFWYFSFVGGLMLLSYAIYRMDPVFIIGQATGLIIYSRNIYFIWQGKKVDERSDLYSLGLVFWELLTGQRALHGATLLEVTAVQMRTGVPASSSSRR